MTTGILLLNFGEPEHATPAEVVPFLERIFLLNAQLEGGDAAARRARAAELAERRAPGLIAEYEEIGGSPLHAQARRQAELLEAELRGRGRDVVVVVGMQFTDPTIADAVGSVREAGADEVVALPVYPISGPSTTEASLAELRRAMAAAGWDAPVREVRGWHAHPDYVALRADGVRALCSRDDVDLHDPRTALVFSAHGTPTRYLREGSRYDRDVAEHCRLLAANLGVDGYVVGFQNHTNRPGVEWTQPDIGRAIRDIRADRIVVVPVSFMHEQSETLAELDGELREEAESIGLGFHRVPIPVEDPRFIRLLAELADG